MTVAASASSGAGVAVVPSSTNRSHTSSSSPRVLPSVPPSTWTCSARNIAHSSRDALRFGAFELLDRDGIARLVERLRGWDPDRL